MNDEVISKSTAFINSIEPGQLYAKGFLALIFLASIFSFYKFAVSWVTKNIENNEARYHARKRIRLASFIIFSLLAFSFWSSELRNLSVFLGFAGAGIAFALQEVIVSIAGWFAVLTGRFYSPGDRIQLGGICGDVLDIGVLRTTLMECGQWVRGDQYNGRIVRVANSFIFKEPVFNYSAEFPFLWDEILVPVKTNSDQTLARKIIEDVGREVVGEYTHTALENWKTLPNKYRIENVSLEPIAHNINLHKNARLFEPFGNSNGTVLVVQRLAPRGFPQECLSLFRA
ncbi:MAG: mechanosensitive ion channel [Bdellovibrionales bacterium]|nr:mechanosensitive ion channel [Bdellovibrionales bacterium]